MRKYCLYCYFRVFQADKEDNEDEETYLESVVKVMEFYVYSSWEIEHEEAMDGEPPAKKSVDDSANTTACLEIH
jgi:hypothetical protein